MIYTEYHKVERVIHLAQGVTKGCKITGVVLEAIFYHRAPSDIIPKVELIGNKTLEITNYSEISKYKIDDIKLLVIFEIDLMIEDNKKSDQLVDVDDCYVYSKRLPNNDDKVYSTICYNGEIEVTVIAESETKAYNACVKSVESALIELRK